ncbi:MAG: SDR family oxidoreductase [Acidothermales bacterium]|jgi:dTDP-4-dehydrorhamnose reductase|nr:SDR family oxidoreductase [Acidothermales bacterium]
MRLLVLGGDGMLGHELLRQLGARHEVKVTLRRPLTDYATGGIFHGGNSIGGVDVRDTALVRGVLAGVRPDAVVNAVGIVKQRPEGQDPVSCLEINALFPHRLAELTADVGARLIHLSTDCVFSGQRGRYTEDDRPDATDVYGLTKLLGEVSDRGALTLRSSIIGLELESCRGLVEWFWQQTGSIRGFHRAIYTGLTTMEMSRVIERLLRDHPDMSGLWQVASEPITKYELLQLLAKKCGRDDITVESDDSFACDRSLIGARFADATGYAPPSWDEMTTELAAMLSDRTDS